MPSLATSMSKAEVASQKPQEVNDFSEFEKPFSNYTDVAKEAIKSTIALWREEIQATQGRRLVRQIRINVEEEVKKRNLEEDEAWCPVHLVDSNINREQAKYAQYVLKSSRNAIISCVENPAQDTAVLERDFTDKSRYNAWELPILKYIDGTQTHAWDSIEIEFDINKPGHFSTVHIGHDKLLFPTDTKDIQMEPFIIRLCDYTNKDLIKFCKQSKNPWNKEQVLKILSGNRNKKEEIVNRSDLGDNKKFKLNTVEKVFFYGDDDIVYVGWSCAEYCDDWLREPMPLFLGKIDPKDKQTQLYETSYPIELFPYKISENDLIFDLMGRVDYYESTQEAATSLLSSFVTGHRRAIQPYFSTDQTDGAPIEEIQTNIKLRAGRLMKGVKQWQMAAPEDGALNAINTLVGQSQMESGSVNYAISSNKSTRKTAAEVDMAGNEDELLSTVQQSLLSISLRNVFTRCFDIYQSRVRAGLIKVLPEILKMLTDYTYIVKPSGDTDVIERQQKVRAMLQTWQIFQQTGAQSVFLKNLTELLFPDEAEQYIAAFAQDDVKNKLIEQLNNLIKSLIIDPATGAPHPEFAQYVPQLQQLEQMVQQALMPKLGDATDTPPSNNAPLPNIPQVSENQ